MPQPRTLDIRGYHDEPVPNTFVEQDTETPHLAILLPGFGYTCHMPLLYYSSQLLSASGADVLEIEYAYKQRPDFAAASEEERANWLIGDVTSACQVALDNRSYSRITIVAKSLGTLAQLHLLTQVAIPASAEAVWLTPVLGYGPFMRQIERWRGRSLFVIGTRDPYYDPALLSRVATATGGETLVIEGADHSMEIEGDIYASLSALEQVIRRIESFLHIT